MPSQQAIDRGNPYLHAQVTMTEEPWLFILIISNILTGFIVIAVRMYSSYPAIPWFYGSYTNLQNLTTQLSYISLLNTTYFDRDGNKAYKKQRFGYCVAV